MAYRQNDEVPVRQAGSRVWHGRAAKLAGRPVVAVALGLLVLGAGAGRAAEAPSWRIERGDVHVVVPMKPGGAFEATTSSLLGTLALGAAPPVSLTGELSVDLATLDTGIGLRNRHLREKYLEVAKGKGYDKAVLSQIHLTEAKGVSFEGKSGFTGTLVLHNVQRLVTGTAEVRRAGSGVRVEASFPPDPHRLRNPAARVPGRRRRGQAVGEGLVHRDIRGCSRRLKHPARGCALWL